MLTTRMIAAICGMIACTVVANLFLKLDAVSSPETKTLFGHYGWRTIAGMFFFGVAFLIYTWVLKTLPLHVAQSLAAGQLISVILASALVLSESISPVRWMGIGLIALGILVVSWTVE